MTNVCDMNLIDYVQLTGVDGERVDGSRVWLLACFFSLEQSDFYTVG